MGFIKNIVKTPLFLSLITLFMFSVNIFSMENTKNKVFIHEAGTNNGIWIDQEFIQQNCQSIAFLLEDLGESEQKEIPLSYPFETIQRAFGILEKNINVNDLSLEQLLNVADLFNFLEIPADILQTTLETITTYINESENILQSNALKELNYDLQKQIIITPTINCLKNCIIKKYINLRKKTIIGHQTNVKCVAFNPNGTQFISSDDHGKIFLWNTTNPYSITQKTIARLYGVNTVAFHPNGIQFVSGSKGDLGNLTLWNIANLDDITSQVLIGHDSSILAVAFSHDGTKTASGDDQGNLLLWDITNPNNITHKKVVQHSDAVTSIAFSSDDTKIFSSNSNTHDNLMVSDITNPNNIVSQTFINNPKPINSIALSPDNKYLVTGNVGSKNNLIIWDITNPNNIISQKLNGHPTYVDSVAFNPNGICFASGCGEHTNNLIIWDMTHPKNITPHVVIGHPNDVLSIAFNHNGTQMLSGCWGLKNNLILWTLLTEQEQTLLSQLKNYDIDQILLMYQFCLQSTQGTLIKLQKNSAEEKIFNTLSPLMQELLLNLFMKK